MRSDVFCTRCGRSFAPQGISLHLRACLRGEGGLLIAVESFHDLIMRQVYLQVRGETTVGALRQAASNALDQSVGPLVDHGGALPEDAVLSGVLSKAQELEAGAGVHLRVVSECAAEDRVAATDRPEIPGTHASGALRIRVDLRHVRPRVWRRITLPASATFHDLHAVLQAAMPWSGMHLHQFEAHNLTIGGPGLDWGMEPMVDEETTRLCDILAPGTEFVYWYDFGDDWFHDLRVEVHEDVDAPRLLDGEGAAPPEDCGGPPGYAHLREVLDDAGHDEHEEAMAWAGGMPSFDKDQVARRVRESLAVGGWVRA